MIGTGNESSKNVTENDSFQDLDKRLHAQVRLEFLWAYHKKKFEQKIEEDMLRDKLRLIIPVFSRAKDDDREIDELLSCLYLTATNKSEQDLYL